MTPTIRWILGGAATLILGLASLLASDLRTTVQHQSSDISALQQSQAAERQALEDIRHDVHELVEMGHHVDR